MTHYASRTGIKMMTRNLLLLAAFVSSFAGCLSDVEFEKIVFPGHFTLADVLPGNEIDKTILVIFFFGQGDSH